MIDISEQRVHKIDGYANYDSVIYRASQMSLYIHFSFSIILSHLPGSVYRILIILTYYYLLRFYIGIKNHANPIGTS